ncbi:MAG: OmpA family protein, partial [Nitrospinales bacterium]
SRLDKEKSALFKEVKRLREQSRPSEDLITKITKVEEQAVKNEVKYKELLREKEEMIEAYNKMLIDNQGKTDGKVPSEIIDELREELDQMVAEKANLETIISEYKKNVRDKIAIEKNKLQEVYKEKAKIVKRQKKNVHDFVAELIDEEKGAPPWVITFADMMTLLLTFFVVLYSIASLNTERFKRMILGSDAPGTSMLELIDAISVKQSLENLTGLNKKNISSEIKEIVEENEEETLGFNNENGRIVIRIPGKALFKPGTAVLAKNSQRVLNEIIKVVRNYPLYNINIQGHTDDTPISTEKFPTNWELSSVRATAVLRFFIDKEIDPKRLTATGFADMFPLVSNETELGRSKNRRVEIVLEKEKIE